MRSLNRVTLMGHLAADVDFRQTQNGVVLATFPVATNRLSKDKDGEKKEIADFHRIVAWGKLGEICHEYLSKGVAVYVEGKLINRSFESKSGEKHFRAEIMADNLNILTWKKTKTGEEVGIEPISENEVENEMAAV